MPTYRYEVRNTFTNAVVADLDLYGVYCTRQMNEAGQFQGTFKLNDDSPLRNAVHLDATKPGLHSMLMFRNDVLIWGGFIWSRSYNAQGQNMQVYASTWESYLEHMVFWKDHFIQQKVLQEDIFSAIWTQLQGQSAASNVGLTIPSLPTTGIKRTVLIPNYEYHFGTDAMQQVIGVDLGLEYTIQPNKQIIVAKENELGTQSGSPVMTYDYPGQITNYWLPESGAAAGIKTATLGAGTGNKVLRAVTEDTQAIASGYPEWWKVTNYNDIADITVLQGKNVADFEKYRMPYVTPTFDMKPDESFNQFDEIGSDFQVTIQDVRYPNGTTFRSRMLGWELTPESGDSPEILKLSIDGSRIVA